MDNIFNAEKLISRADDVGIMIDQLRYILPSDDNLNVMVVATRDAINILLYEATCLSEELRGVGIRGKKI